MNRPFLSLTRLEAIALLALAACTDSPDPVGPLVTPQTPNALIVPMPGPLTQISSWAKNSHSCALRNDGVAVCWGDNGSNKAPPTKAAATGRFTQVSVGASHSCALRDDGAVECWGLNTDGQAPSIQSPPAGLSFTQVGAGREHTCAVRNDGVIECWGRNVNGQAPPIKSAASGAAFAQVSGGSYQTCAVRTDGVIECWGIIGWFDLGQAPAMKASLNGSAFIQVSAGFNHTCATRADGAVECFGLNNDGHAAPITTPANGSPFTQVTTGNSHTCAVRTDGVVECWGTNLWDQAPAVRTATVGGFTQVATAEQHTCGLRQDGYVECWGTNSFYNNAPPIFPVPPAPDHVLPTASFSATPGSVSAGESFTLTLADAQVPGHPEATSFTYAFNCGGGSGYGAFTATNSASCPTSAAGTRTVKGMVKDQDSDAQEYTATVVVTTPPDDTPPVLTPIIDGEWGSDGWYTSNVTVRWSVSDPESEITFEKCFGLDVTEDTRSARSQCGVTSAGGTSLTEVVIKRDATSPKLTFSGITPAPNAAGWNRTSVAVNWTCTDATSGVADAPETQIVTSEGRDRSARTECVDNAGNKTSDTQSGINIDKTAPTLAPTVSSASVALNGTLTALPNGSDGLSGIATQSCATPNTSSVGSKTVECTATDRAGNTTTKTVSYTVTYGFSGFSGPIDGSSGVMNVAKAGQTIPLKWRVVDASGAPITTLSTAVVTVTSLACSLGTTSDDVEEYATGGSGLQNLGDGYYQFNWATAKNYAGSCKTMQLDLGEGLTRTAQFRFTK